MAKRTYFVRAAREEEAGAFVFKGGIIGLQIEAATLDEFEDILKEVAPKLIVANHRTAAEPAEKAYEDLIPTILWQRPAEAVAA